MALVGALLLVATVVVFLSGLAGRPLGWLWAPVVLAGGAAAVSALVWWRRPFRPVAVAAFAIVAALAGAGVRGRTPPGPVTLGRALDEVGVPARARLQEESSGGNVLCFDVCPNVRRRYVVPAAADDVIADMRSALRRAGYELTETSPAGHVSTELDGALHISVHVEPGPRPSTTVLQVSATASG